MIRKPARPTTPEVLPEDLPKADLTANARTIMAKRWRSRSRCSGGWRE